MLKALGLRRGDPTPEVVSNQEKTKLILNQVSNFEVALKAMDYVLDDRAEQGKALLKNNDETISKLALGVIEFIEATLGFEHDVMRKASDTLSQAENASYSSRNFNIKKSLKTSSVYPVGTEYLVTLAESTLLNALIMLLQENGVVESAKALFKLRKAYQTLDEINKLIVQNERMKNSPLYSNNNQSALSLSTSSSMQSNSTFIDMPFRLDEQQLKDKKLLDNLEKVYKMRTSRKNGAHIGNKPIQQTLRRNLVVEDEDSNYQDTEESLTLVEDTSTVDEFIHSGVNLCYGILQVVLSLIPPAIGKVLSIVGFKGSREIGLKMLWKAASTRNIHGELGLLALLVFYDGPFQFTDADFDIPDLSSKQKETSLDSNQSSSSSLTQKKKVMDIERKSARGIGEPTLLYPGKKLEDTLLRARATFPNSALWLLQEARMLASRGKLGEAVTLLDSHNKKIEMRQVEGLLLFDRATMLVFLHDYERAAKDFLNLIQVNSWSHALYTYFAGCCYLEIYRMIRLGIRKDIENLSKFKEQAETYIRKAPNLVPNKKGFMSKPMPFDKLLMRKISSAKKLSQETGLSFVDCFGTSPVHELSYFWNGFNRMPEKDLQLSLKLVGYSGNKGDEYTTTDAKGESIATIPETKDESMIRYFLSSLVLRRLGEVEKGMKLLDTKVLSHIIVDNSVESFKFHKLSANPYLYPTSLYEKALFIWKSKGVKGLKESKEWLKKAELVGDGDYELSARTGMKIKAAIDRLEGL